MRKIIRKILHISLVIALIIPLVLQAALVETLQDNFNDNSLDNTKWGTFGSGVSESSQQLNITVNGASPEYTGLYAANDGVNPTTYDLTGSYGLVEIKSTGTLNITSWEIYLSFEIDGSNAIFWVITTGGGGTLTAYKKISNTQTSIFSEAYSATDHRWLRIREAGGTTYWDTSADGVTWVNKVSASNPIVVTALKPILMAGMWQNESPNNRTAVFDNFNLPPVATSAGVESDTIIFE